MKNNLFSAYSAWVWLNQVPDVNCYLQFCQRFTLAEDMPLRLHLSAEGQYVAYLDGTWIPSTQYPDYPHHKSVQQIEVAPPFQAGAHTLEIQVHYPGADTSVTRRERPGLRFELWQGTVLLAASGSGTPARLLTGYRSGPVANITGQLGVGFSWSCKEPEPWQAAVAVCKPCTLVHRPINELQVGEVKVARLLSQGVFTSHSSDLQQYAALSFRERWQMMEQPESNFPSAQGLRFTASEGDGIYLILDLGEETVGYLDIDTVCPGAARVAIGFGEHLDDLRVRTDVGSRHFTVQYEAGPWRQRFVHRFLRLGGRYLQLFFYSHEVTVFHAGLQPVNYPVRAEGTFCSSDHLFDRIFTVSKHTLRSCLHQHYEDCPWREQALYAFDSRNQMLAGYYAFGEFTQPRESLRLLALSVREDGLLELCAPARVEVNIPSFSLMFVTALEEYCRYSGDVEFGREMLPVAAKILRTLHTHLHHGLMWNFPGYWNFYEWRPLLSGEGEVPSSADSALQLFYLLALQRMGRICGYLKLEAPGLAEEISTVAGGLEHFWNPMEGAYASFLRDGEQMQYAELIQSLVLYTDACPEDRCEALCGKLFSGKLVPVSLAYSIFKYEALLQQPEGYGTQVFEEIAARWGRMLYSGATTFWETDVGAADFGWAGSLCHGWSGIPVYLFGAYLLGVRPEEPGKWIVHRNEPAVLYHAKGTFYPPQGEITVITDRT